MFLSSVVEPHQHNADPDVIPDADPQHNLITHHKECLAIFHTLELVRGCAKLVETFPVSLIKSGY